MVAGNHSHSAGTGYIIPAGPVAVMQAATATRDFAAAQGINGDNAARLAIVVEELVANVVEHARLPAAALIRLDLAQDAGRVRITLEDDGAPFDPRGVASPLDLPPERGGGAGLAIIRAWAIIESYARVGENNRLVLGLPLLGG
jgi:serine/threonine-protein kinase RsbW